MEAESSLRRGSGVSGRGSGPLLLSGGGPAAEEGLSASSDLGAGSAVYVMRPGRRAGSPAQPFLHLHTEPLGGGAGFLDR